MPNSTNKKGNHKGGANSGVSSNGKEKKGINKTMLALEIGAGLMAVGAAGYYFFASKDGKKKRQIIASWAKDLKHDAEKKIKVLKTMDKTAVTRAIEQAAAAYKGKGEIRASDLADAVSELKRNWKKLASA